MKKVIGIGICLFIYSYSYAQTHTPSVTNIDGYKVTFDSPIMEIKPEPKEIIYGVNLTSTNVYASMENNGKIILRVEPDVSYSIRMLGKADDPENPVRNVVNGNIIVPLTDDDKLRDAWWNLGKAIQTIRSIDPDFDKLSNALGAKQPEPTE